MTYWVLDWHRHEKFGPFDLFEQANVVRAIVRLIPDAPFYEEDPNMSSVFVVGDDTMQYERSLPCGGREFYTDTPAKFLQGDMHKVLEQNLKWNDDADPEVVGIFDPFFSYDEASRRELFAKHFK